MKDMVTGKCPKCGDTITFYPEDRKIAECAEHYFDEILDDDYFKEVA